MGGASHGAAGIVQAGTPKEVSGFDS